jgi:hypothetical protein
VNKRIFEPGDICSVNQNIVFEKAPGSYDVYASRYSFVLVLARLGIDSATVLYDSHIFKTSTDFLEKL